MDAMMNPNFIQVKMWRAIKLAIEEEQLFSFALIAETLNQVSKVQICVQLRPLKGSQKNANVNLEPESYSLVAKYSCKTPTELHECVQFRLTLDDSFSVKRYSCFLEFNFKST